MMDAIVRVFVFMIELQGQLLDTLQNHAADRKS